jgi:hypothetical protein
MWRIQPRTQKDVNQSIRQWRKRNTRSSKHLLLGQVALPGSSPSFSKSNRKENAMNTNRLTRLVIKHLQADAEIHGTVRSWDDDPPNRRVELFASALKEDLAESFILCEDPRGVNDIPLQNELMTFVLDQVDFAAVAQTLLAMNPEPAPRSNRESSAGEYLSRAQAFAAGAMQAAIEKHDRR